MFWGFFPRFRVCFKERGTALNALIWRNVSVKTAEISYGCSHIFLSRLLSESTDDSIYLFILNGKLP